ncbi:EF hand domain protein [Acinetobacter phage vB_AbaM_phiAbaA1]|uniref:EF hand domain protein n=1 Tax=Acinetobacter phage vB_AbaM_phiAbaA1 TaxID=1605379 RepID=UPI00078C4119|nr:EF hand domain protein [Acinetobacter phage vB_AbaM_phiAbaA1]AJK27160.1 EF hand domain protein [Acinetobacter phage vB_AbaM_phiAbaA1]
MKLTKGGFDILRSELFKSFTESQVNALNFLVMKCKEAGMTYPETAYALATVYHETGVVKGGKLVRTMLPVEEQGSDKYLSKYDTGKLATSLGNTQALDGDGQKYKGRGYVQLTGTRNYALFSKLLGVDLLGEPELAMDPEIAAKIMTYGMLNGSFTGVGFRRKRPVSKYNKAQYIAARNIINGSDRANDIAGYAMIFERALRSY